MENIVSQVYVATANEFTGKRYKQTSADCPSSVYPPHLRARKEFWTGRPPTNFGPVQPFGVRRKIMGQRGLVIGLPERAASWIFRISSYAHFIVAASLTWIAWSCSSEAWARSP